MNVYVCVKTPRNTGKLFLTSRCHVRCQPKNRPLAVSISFSTFQTGGACRFDFTVDVSNSSGAGLFDATLSNQAMHQKGKGGLINRLYLLQFHGDETVLRLPSLLS